MYVFATLDGPGRAFQSKLCITAAKSRPSLRSDTVLAPSEAESGRKDITTVKIRDDDLPTYALIILFSKEHGAKLGHAA